MMKRNISFSIFYTAALALVLLLGPHTSQAFVNIGVSINVAPPELPVYEQPPVPGPGYLWTPGYWAWGPTPVAITGCPAPGWKHRRRAICGLRGIGVGTTASTSGMAAIGARTSAFTAASITASVTAATAYEGGYWDHGAFRYNSAYNNIHDNTHITNVYNKTVINNDEQSRQLQWRQRWHAGATLAERAGGRA